MLYILNQSPYIYNQIALLRTICPGDDLLMLSNGVIASIKGSIYYRIFNSLPIKLYALESDIAARGIVDYVSHEITIINYTGFVKLTEKHPKQMNL